MKNKLSILCFLLSLFFLMACRNTPPENYNNQAEAVIISPDYAAITIPRNIAPLNFFIEQEADDYCVRLYNGKGGEIVQYDRTLDIPIKKWHALIQEKESDTLYIDVFLKKEDKWFKYNTIKNVLSEFPIDPYISYRLIEPSYVTYEELVICQRDLTTFEETDIFNNEVLATTQEGQCINCHSYQNYRTDNMLFHVRKAYPGTVIVNDGKVTRHDLKTPETISSGVYPAWHPSANLIAFSVNDTRQVFHARSSEKVEVQDAVSDLILYDIENNTVQHISNEKDALETFPSWSPDGKTLYYVSAYFPHIDSVDLLRESMVKDYKNVKYDLLCKSFDLETKTFGPVDTVLCGSKAGYSITFPRVSPNGDFLMFTVGLHGTFHIWHKSSDLYLMELNSRRIRPMREINSPDVESYHTWSSNGRWVIFSTRRDDGSYTRPYITYIDSKGRGSKPFILPQRDPKFYANFYKSYNIPEFMIEPVKTTIYDFSKVLQKEAIQAQYKLTE